MSQLPEDFLTAYQALLELGRALPFELALRFPHPDGVRTSGLAFAPPPAEPGTFTLFEDITVFDDVWAGVLRPITGVTVFPGPLAVRVIDDVPEAAHEEDLALVVRALHILTAQAFGSPEGPGLPEPGITAQPDTARRRASRRTSDSRP